MTSPAEAAYRHELSQEPDCLITALDSVLPPDTTADTPSTHLVRSLCFEPAQYDDEVAPPFSEQFPYMFEHGVRQIALATAVLADDEIQNQLPGWFDAKLFGQGLLVADAGLAFVPAAEVEIVHEYGPRYANYYTRHPEYGYGMAQAIGIPDRASQMLAAMIARHHSVQARNAYGMEWQDIGQSLLDPEQVDLMVALQKPFDFFDDCFDRGGNEGIPYETLVAEPIHKFIQASGALLCRNLSLFASMERTGFDPALPARIAAQIQATVLGDSPIGMVYRALRPPANSGFAIA